MTRQLQVAPGGPMLIRMATSKRRWMQFSLRGAFFIVTLLCVALSLWIMPAERQRRAVGIIEARGGRAKYAERYPTRSFVETYLRRWLPRTYFNNVEQVDLSRSKVTDADLASLSVLTTLRSLAIDDTQITDVGLAHLHRLRKLERLTFSRTSATLDGRARLQRELPDCRVAGP
jgi:hypothetical protein